MLIDPQYQIQHQKTSRPPVPKFPNVGSSLGKRSQDRDDSGAGGTKRQRQFDIPQTLREESLVSSIERDHPSASVDVVEATQSLSQQEGDGNGWRHSVQNVKAESPEYWRAWQNMPAASVDELEQLQEQPTGFISRRRASKQSSKTQTHPGPNGLRPQSIERTNHQRVEDSQAPITPPSEPSHRHASSTRRSLPKIATNSPRQQSSASASKFKKAPRRDIYDYPESDIDDSQMSPRSKMATLRQQKSIDHLSHIENQRSPELGEDSSRRFSVSEAMNFLDNGTVFNDNGIPENSLQTTTSVLNSKDYAVNGLTSGMVYDDADANNENSHVSNGHQNDANVTSPSDAEEDDQEKENRPILPRTIGIPQKSLGGRHTPPIVSLESATQGQSSTPASAKKRKRARKSRVDSMSVDGDNNTKSMDMGFGTASFCDTNKSFRRESGNEMDTASLDSPGEQLSLSLQESARKSSSAQTLKKPPEAEVQLPSSPLTKTTHRKGHDRSTSHESQLSTKKADKNKGSGSTTSTKPAKRQRKSKQNDIKVDPPAINVEQVEKTMVPSSPPPKTLPNWGSTSPAAEKKKPALQDQKQSLTVDNRSESRKSPSAATGLTEEEIKIMKSREGMTKEQYEAEKKKRQFEAKQLAAEQKKKEATMRRESTGKSSVLKPEASTVKTPPTTVASLSKPSVGRKSLSTDNGPGSIKGKKSSGDAASTTAKSTTSTKKSASAKADAAATFAKTPSKKPTKSPSVKSATTTNKPTKTSAPTKTESKNLNASGSKKSTTAKPDPKPEPKPTTTTTTATTASKAKKPPVSTIRQAQSLKALHQVMKSAQGPMISTTTTTSRASSLLNHKRSALNSASDDDSDDAESSSSDGESESESEKNKKSQQQKEKKVVAGGKPDAGKKQPVSGAAKDKTDMETSSSGSTEESDEDEFERMQTQAARIRKLADARPRSASSRPAAAAAATTVIGRPDPSIRDASVDPSSSEDDDSDGGDDAEL